MGQPRGIVVGSGTGEAEQTGMIAEVAEGPSLGDGLARCGPQMPPMRTSGCERSCDGPIESPRRRGPARAEQAVPRVADGELCRVNADGQPAGPGGQ